MKRIDTTNRSPDLFGAGKDGFRNGDLALGVAPTEFNADWPNGVQEEILSVVEASGQAPNGGVLNQLLLALRSTGVFQTQAVGDDSTKAATTGWVRAAMSNIATAAGFAVSLTANGYIKLPSWLGGLILQWGSAVLTTMSVSNTLYTTGITFPLAFPTACRSAHSTPSNCPTSYVNTASEAITSTGFNIVSSIGTGTGASFTARWWAVGH